MGQDEPCTKEDHVNKDTKLVLPEVATGLKEESDQFADNDVEQQVQGGQKVDQEAELDRLNTGGIDAALVKTIEGHASIDDPVEPPARNAPKRAIPSLAGTGNNETTNDAETDLSFFPINSKSILSRLFDPDRKQKPQLWEHIKLVAPGPADQPPPGHIKWRSKDAVSAYCLKCRKQFTYTKGTSKTVSRHMQAYHGLVLNEDKEDYKPSQSATAAAMAAMTNAAPLKKRKMEQSAQQHLLHWIVSSFQPWSIVESPGMQDFVTCLSPSSSFVLPNKQELLQLAIDTVERVKWETRRLLKECDEYSLVCHVFAQQGPQHDLGNPHPSYATSVIISFCTPNYELQKVCLGVLSNNCDKEALQALLLEYSLSLNKITHITITGVTEKLDLGGLRTVNADICVLYQMNAILQQTCQAHGAIANFLSSEVFMKSYHQSFIERAYHHTATPAANSMELDETTTTTVITSELHRIMSSAMTSILKPFYDAYMTLCKESYPTVALTILIFRRIRDVLAGIIIDNYTKDDQDAKFVLEAFHKDLIDRFQIAFRDVLPRQVDEGKSQAPLWTIPTDPRLIHMGGLSDQEKEVVIETLIHQVAEKKKHALGTAVNTHQVPSHATTQVGSESKSIAKLEEPSTMGGIFWGDEAGVDSEKEPVNSRTNPADEQECITYAKTSLDQYFATVKSQRRIEDPLIWWTTHHLEFPELGEIAKTWLAASAVGPREDKRSRYDDEKIDLMVFLHDNATLVLTA